MKMTDLQACVSIKRIHLRVPAVVIDGVSLCHPQHWTLQKGGKQTVCTKQYYFSISADVELEQDPKKLFLAVKTSVGARSIVQGVQQSSIFYNIHRRSLSSVLQKN